MVQLPSYTDYQSALQHPEIAFGLDVDLRSASVEMTALRQPRVRSGSFAYTYRLVQHNQSWAVRCFSKYVPTRDRYQAIARFMQSRPERFLVAPSYQDRGISVKGQWYPIIKMPWVSGDTLTAYVDAHVGDQGRMSGLLQSFERMVADLEALGMAHGDLQHGNILANDGQLILVDYDGTYVPGLQGYEAKERGHPNYQHPARDKEFGPALDRFSSIVIDLALRGLIQQPALWRQYRDGESLLFHQKDFLDSDKSRLLADLGRLSSLTSFVALFRRVCRADVASVPRLDDFLASRVVVDLPARAATVAKWELYSVVAADQREALLGMVGDRVTVVGRVAGYALNTTVTGKPYAFVDFGDWRLGGFRLVIWSEGLQTFRRQDTDLSSLAGRWVSVTGLLDEYRSERGADRLQIVVETPSEIEVLSGMEDAQRRLSGKSSSRPAPAGAAAKRSVQDTTTVSTPPPTVQADQYLVRGVALHKSGKHGEARAAYEAALRLDPHLVAAHYNLGLIFQSEKRTDEALKAFEAALQVQPHNADALKRLGWLWIEKGRYDRSAQAFQAALGLNGTDGDAYYGLGYGLGQQRRHADAIQAYEKAARYAPTSQTFSNLAWNHMALSDLVAAEQACAKALEMDTTNTHARELMAQVQQTRSQQQVTQMIAEAKGYLQTGQWPRAAQLLQDALLRWPDLAEARVMLAEAYAALGRHGDAYRQAQLAATTYGSLEAKKLLVQWQPRLSVSPAELDFGAVLKGSKPALSVEIRNTGRGLLQGKVSRAASWLSVSPQAFECEPGQVQKFLVEIREDAQGTRYDDRAGVVFESNSGSTSIAAKAEVRRPILGECGELQPVVLDRTGKGSTTGQLRNAGAGQLSAVLTVRLTGRAQVQVVPAKVELGEGEQKAFALLVAGVEFSPTIGLPSGEVMVKSNGGDAELGWRCEIGFPMLSVAPLDLDYGTYDTGVPPVRTLEVKNLGTEVLVGTVKSGTAWLRLDSVQLQVLPGKSMHVSAQVVPEAAKLRFPQLGRHLEGQIEVETNGGEVQVRTRLLSRYIGSKSVRRKD